MGSANRSSCSALGGIIMDLLFTYGTLRKAYPHVMADLLAREAQWLGPAKVGGYLYDLGNYPGLVADELAEYTVFGDVFQLYDPHRLLPILDDYEGTERSDGLPPEYERSQIQVFTDDGQPIRCWAYLLILPAHRFRLIEHGDYLRYRAER